MANRSSTYQTLYQAHSSAHLSENKLPRGDISGKPVLYLPHKLFRTKGWEYVKWDPATKEFTNLAEEDVNPLPATSEVASLPFEPHARGLRAIVEASELARYFGPLIRHHKSTTITSQTDIAAAVKNLPESKRLKVVRCSQDLLQRLQLYADPNSRGVVPSDNSPTMADIYQKIYGVPYSKTDHRGLTTWRGPVQDLNEEKTYGYPNALQQYDAICGLADWLSFHVNGSTPISVESEAGVQDAVKMRFLQPLELILRTRYSSHANPISDQLHRGEDAKLLQWSKSLLYPRFARVPGSMLKKPTTKSQDSGQAHSKAGYADFVLTSQYGFVPILNIEVKTWWATAYSETVFEQLVNGDNLRGAPGHGLFAWNENVFEATLLKQIWGELHFSQVHLGFATNGSQLIVYMKTGTNELTVSNVISFTDPRMLHILAGLAFASVDLKLRGEDLLRYLCDGSSAITAEL